MKYISHLVILAALVQASSHLLAAEGHVEQKMTLEFAGISMPAALTLPAAEPPRSAVLLVPGSLFFDVDGNFPAWNVCPHAYADLARQLSSRGHAVLRYAKIGPGTGSEVFDEAASCAHRHFVTRVETARAALDLLERKVGRNVPWWSRTAAKVRS